MMDKFERKGESKNCSQQVIETFYYQLEEWEVWGEMLSWQPG